jgi:hypothetical protein
MLSKDVVFWDMTPCGSSKKAVLFAIATRSVYQKATSFTVTAVKNIQEYGSLRPYTTFSSSQERTCYYSHKSILSLSMWYSGLPLQMPNNVDRFMH